MLGILNEFINWIIKNKEWIFSGAGISIIGVIIFFAKRIFKCNKEENIKIIDNSNEREQLPQHKYIKNEEVDTLNDDILRLVDRFIDIYLNMKLEN